MRYILLAVSLAFVGCGSSSDDATHDSTDQSGNDTVGAEIAEDFNKAMKKAEDVEKQIQDSKENIDEALETAEGSVD